MTTSPVATQTLTCGCAPYDADRLRGTIEKAHELIVEDVLAIPHGWVITDALKTSLTDEDLVPVIYELADIKASDRWPNESYPTRLSKLAWTLVHGFPDVPWSPESRRGVAWVVTYLGMKHHHFALRPGEEHAIFYPSPMIFDVSEEVLERLLWKSFFDLDHHRFSYELDRRAQQRRKKDEQYRRGLHRLSRRHRPLRFVQVPNSLPASR
jgi:hypothetical protein